MADTDTQRIHVDGDNEPSGGSGRTTWMALGLAAVVTIGLLSWLPSLLGSEATEAVATSVPTSTSSTTERTVDRFGDPPVLPEPTMTGLGLMVWSMVDFGLMPNSDVQPDRVNGGYYAYFVSGDALRSDDGLLWYFDSGLEPVDPPFFQSGRWGIAYGESSSLYELVGARWEPVATRFPALDESEGLVWNMYVQVPAVTDDRIVVPVELWATIPWEQVYGEFELADCPPMNDDCSDAPWSTWNEFSERTYIHHPGDESIIATLVTIRRGDSIVFLDPKDGEQVWRISFSTAAAAADFFDVYRSDEPSFLRRFGVYTGATTMDLTFSETPFAHSAQVLANDAGQFVAYEEPSSNAGVPALRVWTSTDGLDWEIGPEPEFVDDDFGWATFQGVAGSTFYATVHRNEPLAPYSERWESDDGLVWVPSEIALPADAWIVEADFGYLATAWSNSLPEFWASSDGISWERIPSPEERPGYNGYAIAAGVAGDLIYLVTETPSGDAMFWSARFE